MQRRRSLTRLHGGQHAALSLEMVPSIAPGWDKYYLEAQYRAWVKTLDEPPRHPERAFLGWVRKFTKGRRP